MLQENQRTDAQHISNACSNADALANFHLWAIVGEWSTAPTDCAQWLNGRNNGARYDGSFQNDGGAIGSCTGKSHAGSGFSSSYKTFLRQYYEAQVQEEYSLARITMLISFVSRLRHTKRALDGLCGPGRQRALMIGPIKPVFSTDGFPRTLLSASIPRSVVESRTP